MANENRLSSLIDWQDRFIKDPDLSGEQAHRVRILIITGLLFLIVGLLILIAQLIFWVLPSFPPPPWTDLVADLLIILAGASTLTLVQLGRFRAATSLVLGAILAIATASFVLEGSPLTDVSGTLGFFILVALSAVLLGTDRVWVALAVTAGVFIGVHVLGWQDVLPPSPGRDQVGQQVFTILIWLIAAGITTILIVTTMNVLRSQADQLRKRLIELRKTQGQLRASRENLRTTLDSIGDGVIATDRDGEITRMNPVAEALTGWDFEEAEGRPLLEVFNIVNAKTRRPAQTPVEQVLQEGKIVGLANHTMLIARDGRELQIADSGAPIRDRTGEITGVVLVFRDVTKQYRQREALRESEKRFREMLETVELIAVMLDDQGLITFCNDYLLEITGWEREEIIGASWFDTFIPPEIEEELYQSVFTRTFKKGEITPHYVNDILTREGERRTISWSNTAHRDPRGHVIGAISLGLDITEQMRTQQALQRREARLESIFRAAPIGIGLVSKRVLLQVNDQICEMTGYTRDELIGENAQILYPSEEDYRYVGTEKYAQIREEGIGTVETRWQRKDGRIIEILLSSAVLDLEDMDTASFTALDITERKRAQEALNTYAERLEEMVAERTQDLQQAQEKLVRQEKLATLGQLAGGLAHELRTPLGVIKNSAYYISLVLEEPDSTLRETLTILDQEIDHAEEIIRALLDFASTETPVLLELDLNVFLERLLARFDIPAQVDLVARLDRDVPLIRADATQLERVFENLILNAIQAMPKGGTLTVATEAIQEGQMLVTVDDTGVGIPPDHLDEIFEPLFSTKTTGIGLGLPLTKNLVAAHGGHIEVESEGRPGEGTTFKVYLPINRKEEIEIDDA